jgi:sirohydrochlorin cobaltochelatase
MLTAYLLISHGSRDPRPEIAMQQLASLLCEKLQNQVGTAYLELQPEPLHLQIIEFSKKILAASPSKPIRIKILPLFLLPGVHVMEDIPAEVNLAQQILGGNAFIELKPYLGSNAGMTNLLAKRKTAVAAQKYILLAHGSSRPGFGKAMDRLVFNLDVITAYWAVPPTLDSQVAKLVAAGYKEIAIIPYFLFAGGITDAIASVTEKLQLQFPGVCLQLTQPLGANPELVDLIWDLLNE